VDGIIWCPLGSRRPAALKKLDRPVVLIDRPGQGFAVVHSNYEMGGRLLAKYALSMGHTRVGLLSGPQDLESARQRRNGFANAAPGEIEIVWEVNVGFDGVLTAQAMDALEHRRNATLIVAGNDLIAISAIRWLSKQGVKVPDEISITGFDNIRWTDVVTPGLTTIAQPVGAIGKKAVELMHGSMLGEKITTRHTIFDVELIERDSVRHIGRR
jgi:LacI family transcriptional regulator